MFCQATIPNGNITEAIMCDGQPECALFEDECVEQCLPVGDLIPGYCQTKPGCVPVHLICNGVKESQTLSECNYTYILNEEENCPNRFYCRVEDGDIISIDKSLVCDGVADCDDGSDEAREQCGSSNARFYCETKDMVYYKGVDRKENNLSFVPHYKVLDGVYDCDDGSDECPFNSNEELHFNARTEMIRWTWLQVVLWINAIVAVTGNLTVIVFSLSKMRHGKKFCKQSTAFTCHHILVFNLSMADLLMGVYLTGIAIQSASYSGNYCVEDTNWRLGLTCTVLGSISLISSEVSVYTMLVMAIFRYVTIKDPFYTRFSHSALNKMRVCVLLGWIISIVLSVLPVVHPIRLYFHSSAYVKSPIFSHHTVKTGDLVLLAQKITTASNRGYIPSVNAPSASAMPGVEDTLSQIFPNEKDLQWIGVYGKSSVCLPGLFRSFSDSGWEYCLAIIIVNLLSFFVMMVCYVMLVRVTKKSQQTVQSNVETPIEFKLMKRVTIILITDFICWVPICVVFFLLLSGSVIDPIAFAICGIVLLPINSALNPLIYSGLPDIIIDIFSSLCHMLRTGKSQPTSTTSTDIILNSQGNSFKES